MNHVSKTGFTFHDLRLIGAALAVHKVEQVAASITPMPGTGRFIVVGTPAEIERLLEVAPKATVDQVAHAVCTLPPPGWYCTRERGHEGPCAAHPAVGEQDDSEGGHHD